jgi:hypothetical protein
MRYTVHRPETQTGHVRDDAEVDLDMHDGRADIAVRGSLGPRSASVVRTMFEALDGMPGPVRVDCRSLTRSTDGFVPLLDAARRRRRRLGLGDVTVDAPPDVDGPSAADTGDSPG